MAATQTERIRSTPYRTFDRAYCAVCEKPVKLLTFAEAFDFLQAAIENVRQLAERRDLHRLHNLEGTLMICSESLFRILNNRRKT
jgi:hypothetical protein